ncbi:MAG: hypothetical protein KQH83_10990 [Actinobacteria bacterium]|nr:hypothetical protein [Actinomycetota bacterium]
MTRMVEFLAALAVATAAAGCAASAPSPASTTPPAADESSVLAPVERASGVAEQVNQREADLEQMVAEMGG